MSAMTANPLPAPEAAAEEPLTNLAVSPITGNQMTPSKVTASTPSQKLLAVGVASMRFPRSAVDKNVQASTITRTIAAQNAKR